ncbi:MAG: hypothetical protein DMF88_07725, partial [Acidobacteria bacterium]
ASLDTADRLLAQAGHIPIRAAAAAISLQPRAQRSPHLRLALIVATVADLRDRIRSVCDALRGGRNRLSDPRGIYLGPVTAATPPAIAFLFPGQGSQYPGMHRDLAVRFPVLRHAVEVADHVTAGAYERPLSSYIFPPPAFTREEDERSLRELTETSIAQPALGAVEVGVCQLLRRLGVHPDFAGGHSYGEYAALWCAGVFSTDTLFALSAARGRLIKQATGDAAGTMAAVGAAPDAITQVLANAAGVWIANLNAPRQTVLAGSHDAIDRAIAQLAAAGMAARRIPVACAFHSPLVEPAQRELAALVAQTAMRPPRIPVFSNALGAPYPDRLEDIKHTLSEHLVRPVRFVEEIRAMHAAGARVFLEVGPRRVLSSLARESLAEQDALVLSIDASERPGLVQLLHTLGELHVAGVRIDHEALLAGRSIDRRSLDELAQQASAGPGAHVWMVNGGRARRINGAPVAAQAVPAPSTPAKAAMPPPKNGSTRVLSTIPRTSNGGSMDSQLPTVFERVPRDHEEVMRAPHEAPMPTVMPLVGVQPPLPSRPANGTAPRKSRGPSTRNRQRNCRSPHRWLSQRRLSTAMAMEREHWRRRTSCSNWFAS